MKFAVLDIGTNSIHMLGVEASSPKSWTVVTRMRDMTRLGDGSLTTGEFTAEQLERALEVVRRFHKAATAAGIKRWAAFATAAVREAANGGELVDRILTDTGIRVHVITGTEEARLIFLAIQQTMALGDRRACVLDIGGGSVEIVLGTATGKPEFATSLKLGAARLADTYVHHDPPAAQELEVLLDHLDRKLQEPAARVRESGVDVLVGTSGTILNLAQVALRLDTGQAPDNFNQATVYLKQLQKAVERLAATPAADSKKIPGLDPARFDQLVPGGLVLTHFMRAVGVKELVLSEMAIREGVILDYLRRHARGLEAEEAVENVRLRQVLQLGRQFNVERPHADHVAMLALRIFDLTSPLHGLGEREREWLQYAALLHDIGYAVSYRRHHKHSLYLIQNSQLEGFAQDEIDVIANVARYHRQSLPKASHEAFAGLPPETQEVVRKLGAILRIADALDRSHFGVVTGLHCRVGKRTVRLTLESSADAELELWAARNRAEAFQRVFGLDLTLDLAGNTAAAEQQANGDPPSQSAQPVTKSGKCSA